MTMRRKAPPAEGGARDEASDSARSMPSSCRQRYWTKGQCARKKSPAQWGRAGPGKERSNATATSRSLQTLVNDPLRPQVRAPLPRQHPAHALRIVECQLPGDVALAAAAHAPRPGDGGPLRLVWQELANARM